jgi:hypothetical protein
MKGRGRKYFLLAAVVLGAIAVVYLGSSFKPKPRFICEYPGFQKIANGMTKMDVTTLLGQPKEIKFRNGRKNFMGQGYNSTIEEAWIYRFPLWPGGIEVYFDATDHVVGRNCGYG